MVAMASRVSRAERPWWRGIARCIGCVAVLIAATSVAALQATQHVSDAVVLRTSFQGALAARDWQAAIAAGLELERATGGLVAGSLQPGLRLRARGATGSGTQLAHSIGRSRVAPGAYQVDEDGDLAALRKDPRFVAIRAAVARNWNAYAIEVRGRFHETPPIVVLPKGYDATRPAPLLIALHGHGGRADGWPVQWREVTEKMGVVLTIPQSDPFARGWLRLGWARRGRADRRSHPRARPVGRSRSIRAGSS